MYLTRTARPGDHWGSFQLLLCDSCNNQALHGVHEASLWDASWRWIGVSWFSIEVWEKRCYWKTSGWPRETKTPLLLVMLPGRKLSPKQGVTKKPRCYFNSPMKYFDRYMRYKWHLGLTQHRGNSASYRLKPLLDFSLHGLNALLSKMKTCIRQNSAIEQYTMAHP